MVVPGADAAAAGALAEQLRAGIEQLVVGEAGAAGPRLTASLGVASFPAEGTAADALLHAADAALYRAKVDGRNRVASAPTMRPV